MFCGGEAAGSLRCAVLAKKLCELCGGAPGIGSVVEFFDEYQQNQTRQRVKYSCLPAMLLAGGAETLYGIVCTAGDGPLGTGRAAALQNVLAALSRIDDADFSECIQNLNITRRGWRMQRIFRLPMSQRSSFILKRRPKFRNGRRRRNRPWFGRRSSFQRGGRGAALLWAAVCLRRGKPELLRALRAEKKRLKGLKNDNGAKAPSDSGKRTDVQKHKCVKLSNSAKCALLTVFEALLAAALLVPAAAAAGRLGSAFFPANTRVSAWSTVLTVIFGLMPALSAAFAIEARLMPCV